MIAMNKTVLKIIIIVIIDLLASCKVYRTTILSTIGYVLNSCKFDYFVTRPK